MKIFKKKISLISEILIKKNIAFVPTMGSIHKGHISLMQKAKKKTQNILVSIYVNPKQFDSNSNFKKYPRQLKKDIAILRKIKIKYLYLPTDDDIYSFKPKVSLHIDKFSNKLCGKFRPRHFKGVLNVINRFLEIIKPSIIFLGLKDFQQLALIKCHIKKKGIQTKIISCSTIRESNGVALSSRNMKLKTSQIKIAGKIYKYLKSLKKKAVPLNSKKQKLNSINKIILLGAKKVDYLEYVNLKTLKSVKKVSKDCNIFIAYYIGKIRLIDNL